MDRTRKALLTSLFSVFLCLLMLCGSTYAWFVDSASSTGNKIISGTLGVDLLRSADGSLPYASIANSDVNIFGDTPWNPKDSRTAYLAIKNTGTLPIEFSIALLLSNSNGLEDVLEYKVTPLMDSPQASPTNWDSSFNIGKSGASKTKMIFGKDVSGQSEVLAAGVTKYFAINAYLHTNESSYSGKTASISIKVVASQTSNDGWESGSDPVEAGAVQKEYNSANISSLANDMKDAFNSGKALKVKLTGDIIASDIDIQVEGDSTAGTLYLDLNGHCIKDTTENVAIYVCNGCSLVLSDTGSSKGYISSQNNTIYVYKGGTVYNADKVDIRAEAATNKVLVYYDNN